MKLQELEPNLKEDILALMNQDLNLETRATLYLALAVLKLAQTNTDKSKEVKDEYKELSKK